VCETYVCSTHFRVSFHSSIPAISIADTYSASESEFLLVCKERRICGVHFPSHSRRTNQELFRDGTMPEVARRLMLIVATLVSTLNVVLLGLKVEWPLSAWLTMKGLPVLLCGFVGITCNVKKNSLQGLLYARRIGSGLIICTLGDIALVFEKGFLPGLGLFLFGHLLYSSALAVDSVEGLRRRRGNFGVWMKWFLVLFWGLLLVLVFNFLSKDMEEKLKLPVIFYVATIGFMVYKACARHQPWLGTESYWYAAVGSICFAVSDTILAVDKFVAPFETAQFYVMLTYYAAQMCFASSTILPEKEFQEKMLLALPQADSSKPDLQRKKKAT